MFRADLHKKCMAVSVDWGSFFAGVLTIRALLSWVLY